MAGLRPSRFDNGFLIALAGLLYWEQTAFSQQSNQLSAAVQPFVEKGALAGAVMLVADKDKILSVETAGYADVAAKQPIKADGLFWIASMSKPVTGTALMVLVDEGKVQLDDPVEDTKLPALQLVQVPAPALEYAPAEQIEQIVDVEAPIAPE